MKWSKRTTKQKSATRQALLDLAAKCQTMRRHGQPVPQEIEAHYRQLLAQNYAEKAQAQA